MFSCLLLVRYRRPECGQLLRGTHGYRDEFDSLLSDPSSQETQSSLHHLASHRPEVLFQVYDHSRWPYDSYPVSCQPYILISEHVCVWNVIDLEGEYSIRLIMKVFHFIAIFKSFVCIKTLLFSQALNLWSWRMCSRVMSCGQIWKQLNARLKSSELKISCVFIQRLLASPHGSLTGLVSFHSCPQVLLCHVMLFMCWCTVGCLQDFLLPKETLCCLFWLMVWE